MDGPGPQPKAWGLPLTTTESVLEQAGWCCSLPPTLCVGPSPLCSEATRSDVTVPAERVSPSSTRCCWPPVDMSWFQCAATGPRVSSGNSHMPLGDPMVSPTLPVSTLLHGDSSLQFSGTPGMGLPLAVSGLDPTWAPFVSSVNQESNVHSSFTAKCDCQLLRAPSCCRGWKERVPLQVQSSASASPHHGASSRPCRKPLQ